jgi:nucleoside-diphosphate kinase
MSYGYGDATNKGIPNLIHASGDLADAEKEIPHWFSDDELYDYSALSEKFTR